MSRDLTTHFARREFLCAHGLPSADDGATWETIRRLAEQLEVLRESLGGRPIHIISGFRCPDCNRACNGARNSQHLYGRAADIWVEGLPNPFTIASEIAALIASGRMLSGGIGIYYRGRKTQSRPFTHYDIRGHLARWQQRRR